MILLEKVFSRDFALATIQIWYRAEASNRKEWTEKMNPFRPFIIFEKTKQIVNGYYNPEGILWVKKTLWQKAKQDKNFIESLKNAVEPQLKYLQPIYEQERILDEEELVQFLTHLEKYWSYFEALWWLWETPLEERANFELSTIEQLRKTTGNFAPGSDQTIKKSLMLIYPKIKDFVDVLTTEEIISKNIPPQNKLEERKKGYFFTENKLYTKTSRAEMEKKLGIEFEKLKMDKSIKEFSGTFAYPGIARGKVRKIMSHEDIKLFQKGEILVTPMTIPDYVLAMEKAAAIITDEGGILCHAAIISREMKKPCLVGTKIATQVLKDGDLVEVDATRGVVKILSRK